MIYSYDTGTNWTDPGDWDFRFNVYTSYVEGPAPGNIMICDDTDTDKLAYTGFAITTATTTNNTDVQFSDVLGGFNGLSIGTTYYLKNTLNFIEETGIGSNATIGYNTSTNDKAGQTFLFDTNSGDSLLKSITLKVTKSNSPSDNLVVKLYASDKSTLLATSDLIAGSTVDTGYGSDKTFVFSNPYRLIYGTEYFFEIERDGAYGITHFYSVVYSSSGSYSDGSLFKLINSVWTEYSSSDLYMILNIDPVIYTSAGVNSVKVGRAISATELLIYQLAI